MLFTREAAEQLRQRLLIAMSMGEAKELLGFPPSYTPSPQEVNKALRVQTFKHHPDRGGDSRKMIELNVAADILKGLRTRDHTPITVDPEEEKRKKRQEAIAKVQDAESLALKARDETIESLGSNIHPRYAIDLREYLIETFAEKLDAIQDEGDKALRNQELNPKAKKDWQSFDRIAEGVASMALRLGAKFGSLKKRLAKLQGGATIADLEAIGEDIREYVKNYEKFITQTKRLNSLLNTSEVIPMALVNDYWDAFNMVSSFATSYKQNRIEIERPVATIKTAIENTLAILKELGQEGLAPRKIEAWVIPGSFEWIIDQIESSRTASAHSVVERFRRCI
jgi:curved DNA-binding protein CbpA